MLLTWKLLKARELVLYTYSQLFATYHSLGEWWIANGRIFNFCKNLYIFACACSKYFQERHEVLCTLVSIRLKFTSEFILQNIFRQWQSWRSGMLKPMRFYSYISKSIFFFYTTRITLHIDSSESIRKRCFIIQKQQINPNFPHEHQLLISSTSNCSNNSMITKWMIS